LGNANISSPNNNKKRGFIIHHHRYPAPFLQYNPYE
jgi:hypothetical protein